jgi:uncharacterized membrane protein YbjE (DUF340 family)
MEVLTGLLLIFAFLAAGMAAERLRLVPRTDRFPRVMDAALALLLVSMGIRIGLLESVSRSLLRIGSMSLAFAAATVAGTALAIVLLSCTGCVRRRETAPPSPTLEPKRSRKELDPPAVFGGKLQVFLEPFRLFFFVAAGFLAAFFLPVFGWFRDEYTSILLYLLLFLVGIQLVKNEVDLKKTLLHPATLVVPLAVVAGSLLGGILLAPFFGLSTGRALALSSGFGWYSLSGVLITDMGSPVLGAAAFLSNVMRETLALFLIPLFARFRLPRVAIGIAGATSMDVTLPLVERSCGSEYVPLSIANGALLSLLVPFLVPLFFQLG